MLNGLFERQLRCGLLEDPPNSRRWIAIQLFTPQKSKIHEFSLVVWTNRVHFLFVKLPQFSKEKFFWDPRLRVHVRNKGLESLVKVGKMLLYIPTSFISAPVGSWIFFRGSISRWCWHIELFLGNRKTFCKRTTKWETSQLMNWISGFSW
jgi:hypothetical protein